MTLANRKHKSNSSHLRRFCWPVAVAVCSSARSIWESWIAEPSEQSRGVDNHNEKGCHGAEIKEKNLVKFSNFTKQNFIANVLNLNCAERGYLESESLGELVDFFSEIDNKGFKSAYVTAIMAKTITYVNYIGFAG